MKAPWYAPALSVLTVVIRQPMLVRDVRVRQWGRLPLYRASTVVVANHQYENESEIIVERTFAQGPWHKPVHSLGSRRLFEPGFFAMRMPFSAPLTRRFNAEPILRGVGFLPIENQLSSRPLISLADAVRTVHGDLELAAVFAPEALTALDAGARVLSDLWRPAYMAAAQTQIKLTRLNEPYRSETMALTRTTLDRDVAEIVDIVREGATVYVTAEGFYSTDGRMTRLKGVLYKITPVAEVWLAAIGFDPFRGRRLSMLYRIVRPADPSDLDTSLAAARPVTASAVVAAFITARVLAFTAAEAIAGAAATLADVPAGTFVDPELLADPAQCVREVLATLVVRGALTRDGDRYARGGHLADPRFPDAVDMIAYQRAFLNETLAAGRRLGDLGGAPDAGDHR